MTTLAADAPRDYELGDHNDLPVVAGDIIYEGAAVSVNASGYAKPLAASEHFAGFAQRQVDNVAGAAGDQNIRVITRGTVILSVTGLTADDIAKPVYASDDDTFTMTAAGNSQIGRVKRHIQDGLGAVEFFISDNTA